MNYNYYCKRVKEVVCVLFWVTCHVDQSVLTYCFIVSSSSINFIKLTKIRLMALVWINPLACFTLIPNLICNFVDKTNGFFREYKMHFIHKFVLPSVHVCRISTNLHRKALEEFQSNNNCCLPRYHSSCTTKPLIVHLSVTTTAFYRISIK